MMWKVVSRFAGSLSLRFREVYLQYREQITGSRGKDPRWQECIGDVDGSFGMALGVLFVDKKFKGESKSTVGFFLSFSFCFVLFCLFLCLFVVVVVVVVVVVISVSLMIGVCLPS